MDILSGEVTVPLYMSPAKWCITALNYSLSWKELSLHYQYDSFCLGCGAVFVKNQGVDSGWCGMINLTLYTSYSTLLTSALLQHCYTHAWGGIVWKTSTSTWDNALKAVHNPGLVWFFFYFFLCFTAWSWPEMTWANVSTVSAVGSYNDIFKTKTNKHPHHPKKKLMRVVGLITLLPCFNMRCKQQRLAVKWQINLILLKSLSLYIYIKSIIYI